MHRPVVLGLLSLTLGFVLNGVGAARGDTPPSMNTPPEVLREMGYLPSWDGTELAYVAYRPREKGRYPTIVTFNVYDASATAATETVLSFLRRGYAFVAANARGTGCSRGEYVPYGQLPEAKDGAAVVDWAGSQPWSTGSVGMIGYSHAGILQFGTAAQKPKHLKALAAGGTISRTYADGWRVGGIWNAGFAVQWGRVQEALSKRAAEIRVALGDTKCKEFLANVPKNRMFELSREHPLEHEYYRVTSPYDLAPEVDVPILLVQGWNDEGVGGSAPWVFQRLATKHKRFLFTNGGHSVYKWSPAFEEVLRWMDRWVKGEENGVDREPRVKILFETKLHESPVPGNVLDATPGWSRSFSDWPIPQAQLRTLYLTAGGALKSDLRGEVDEGERSYFYPSGTEFPNNDAMFSTPPAPHGSLTYRTDPMKEDTAIIGSPQLTLYLSSEQPDTDLMVALHDVAPNGLLRFLQRSYLRASHRAVDSSRSTSEMVFHPHEKEELLEPGKVYEIKISIWPLAHVLRAGHALELVVMAPPTAPSPGWQLTPVMLPGFNTIHQSEQHRSRLELPVVPNVRAEGPAPECPALNFQPCRTTTPTP